MLVLGPTTDGELPGCTLATMGGTLTAFTEVPVANGTVTVWPGTLTDLTTDPTPVPVRLLSAV